MYTNLQAYASILIKHSTARDRHLAVRNAAWKLFEKAYTRGQRNRWLGRVSRKPTYLATLPPSTHTSRGTTATITVPLERIVGSESRSPDFDMEFNPMNADICDRWIGIAEARLRGVGLPAVELFQVGEQYYVRDGHHRISVARVLGQLDIEARIVN